MANWKKMAEAFGRAVQDPERSRAGDRLVRDAAARFERPREKYEPEFDRVTREPWTDEAQDVNRAFVKGELHGWKDASNAKNVGKDFDEMTDRGLQDDFDKSFEEALIKRRGKIRDAMDDVRDADEAADAGIEDIRKAAIEMLKSGHDIGDVIRILKGE